MENEQNLIKALTALKKEKSLRENEKKLLLDEQNFRKELEIKLIDQEIELKKQNEKIENLTFNNGSLRARVDYLKNQINQGKNQKNFGFLDSFWSGKNKDIIENLENQIGVISEDLKVKIEENEHTHIQIKIFEMKKNHQKEIDETKKKLSDLKDINDKQGQLVRDFKIKEEKFRLNFEDLERNKNELSNKIDELSLFKLQWEAEKSEITKELDNSKHVLSTRICFQDDKNKEIEIYNPTTISFENINKKLEWLCRGLTISVQLQNNFEELVRFVQSKLKIAISDVQYNGLPKEFKLYVFVGERLAKSFAEFADCLSLVLKKAKIIAETSQEITGKNIIRNTDKILKIREKLGLEADEIIEHIGSLIRLGENVKEWSLKLFNEEMNLVENIALNEPIKESLIGLFKILKNFYSYFSATKQLVPEKNQKFIFEKCFEFLNCFSSQLEKLLQSLKIKLQEENLNFKEDEEETGGKLKWTFTIRSALSLKNYNNEILNSLSTTIFSLNSLFTIFTQYFQTEMKSELIPPENLFTISLMNQFYNSAQKSQIGVKYSHALENKKTVSDLHKKSEEQTQQIVSLKNALCEAEEQLENLEETDENKDFEQINNELMALKIYAERIKNKYKDLCSEIGREFEEKFDASTTADNDSEENKDITLNLSEDVEKGYQKIAIKFFNEKNKMAPINELISFEVQNSDKTLILFEKAKSSMKKLLIQNEFLNEKQRDLQKKIEMHKKEIEKWKNDKEKSENESKNLQKIISKNKEDTESLKRNYDQQIIMLSEHIAELTKK